MVGLKLLREHGLVVGQKLLREHKLVVALVTDSRISTSLDMDNYEPKSSKEIWEQQRSQEGFYGTCPTSISVQSFNFHFHGSTYINGFMVVKFCGKEWKVDLNVFHVIRRSKMAIMGWILDFRCMKSI
ncbi:hypothetical protein [Paenibacillus woosongensis]|uniref:Uncharacterized protein n=1 Tax=Paenibacillus woosongensis TaxID=307580 RepID=A0A7X2YZ86_9BACL|nr:hypothetical protein [Paenibacillus woosongensis]MUG44540.1 hypothetical protein [Paenibacillus woosongensis]